MSPTATAKITSSPSKIDRVRSPEPGCIINQREVGLHTKHSPAHCAGHCAKTLTSSCGRNAGLGTISLAVEAATTGHLVFSTCTPPSTKTVDRVIEVFRPRKQAQPVHPGRRLAAVISRRLQAHRQIGAHRALEIMIATPASATSSVKARASNPSMIQTGKKYGITPAGRTRSWICSNRGAISAKRRMQSNDKARFGRC